MGNLFSPNNKNQNKNSEQKNTSEISQKQNVQIPEQPETDLDTFFLYNNLSKREIGNYISSIKDIIDMTLKHQKQESEEELKKAENHDFSEAKEKFKIKTIAKLRTCSEDYNKQIYNFGHCPMLYGLYNCWGCHESISLSPDDFWLMIIQSFSIYILKNSEEFRNYFVNFEGKKLLEIEISVPKIDFISKDDYEKCFCIFKKQISEYVGKDLVQNLQCDFTTSTITTKTVSYISIMTTFQNYFEYQINCMGCGFSSISLTGVVDDYKKILKKVNFLKKYNLGWWVDLLKPIILKIIETKKCLSENRKIDIDFDFWRDMIKKENKIKWERDGSRADFDKIDFISGWIVNFFPFDKKGKKRDEKIRRNKNLGFLVETDCKDLAGEIQCVPVKVVEKEFNKEYNCFLYNGFFGFERDNNQRMKPVVGWFLAE